VIYFSDAVSCDHVDLLIETGARTYGKKTTIEDAVSSVMGLCMAASGCPVMDKLKPMVRYHLPFATLDETRYRALSMHLLSQYFVHRRGKKPDWNLKKLSRIYDEVRVANKHFCERISSTGEGDANVNALIRLDCFAMNVTLLIDKNILDDMESIFAAYLESQ
jgi:hypothetical protein